MKDDSPPPVKAAATSFRVLEGLQELNEAGVSELATHLGASKSSVHSHLRTLEQLGYVIRDEDGSRLSLKFFRVGADVRNKRPIYGAARDEIDRLSSVTGLTAGIAVYEDGFGTCLYSNGERKERELVVSEGAKLPLHATGVGKAILAALPDEIAKNIIERRGLERFTENTIVDADELWDELQTITSRGIAYDKQEYKDNVRGIGTSVVASDGSVLGGIFLGGRSDELTGKQLRQNNPGLVVSTANRIQNSLQSSVNQDLQ